MNTSTEMIRTFASTTGEIMTDGIPLIVYITGLFFVAIFVGLFFKALIKPIKKIFKK